MVAISGSSAMAATYKYKLLDHPERATKTHEYGLRVDAYSKYFSFENGGHAILTYNDETFEVSIKGQMRENAAGAGNFVSPGLWDVHYSISNVYDLGGGFFQSRTDKGSADGGSGGNGSGYIQYGDNAPLALGQKNAGSIYFELDDDGHRLADKTAIVGRGWVNPWFQGVQTTSTNDFLFTAELIPTPLPAAGWLLLAGFGGLGVMKRRRKKA
ncbi:VPLPA-CTERM sorting domain-containing protein [Roseobacter sp. YSTF-M11]|uniref:VPLPA-CTERM sorting domain-containing protein n=2 Tax=Roseobacter insulae TaxID=2859783 RepID=A0A9X1FTX1_9RHOB|nr:VPLPA-CTERM sorting domain-containing protein [Roseobacter insulae]